MKRLRLVCSHELCGKCLNRLETNPPPGSVPWFLAANSREPASNLGVIPAKAYAMLTRPKPEFFLSDEDLERLEKGKIVGRIWFSEEHSPCGASHQLPFMPINYSMKTLSIERLPRDF